MTLDEVEVLANLIEGWGADGSGLTLTCAEDVFGELQEAVLPENVEILKIPHYEPGQWKLTRHDSCDVIGGETIDQALIVSHQNCTVLGQSG